MGLTLGRFTTPDIDIFAKKSGQGAERAPVRILLISGRF
jgi:hypothetical protein